MNEHEFSNRLMNKGQLVDANEIETGIYGVTEDEMDEIVALEAENSALREYYEAAEAYIPHAEYGPGGEIKEFNKALERYMKACDALLEASHE
jgi:hypothetical protein